MATLGIARSLEAQWPKSALHTQSLRNLCNDCNLMHLIRESLLSMLCGAKNTEVCNSLNKLFKYIQLQQQQQHEHEGRTWRFVYGVSVYGSWAGWVTKEKLRLMFVNIVAEGYKLIIHSLNRDDRRSHVSCSAYRQTPPVSLPFTIKALYCIYQYTA